MMDTTSRQRLRSLGDIVCMHVCVSGMNVCACVSHKLLRHRVELVIEGWKGKESFIGVKENKKHTLNVYPKQLKPDVR